MPYPEYPLMSFPEIRKLYLDMTGRQWQERDGTINYEYVIWLESWILDGKPSKELT